MDFSAHPVCTVFRRLPASSLSRLYFVLSRSGGLSIGRGGCIALQSGNRRCTLSLREVSSLADRTISIGAFAGGKTRDRESSSPPSPCFFFENTTERSGFNGQIVRFVRGEIEFRSPINY